MQFFSSLCSVLYATEDILNKKNFLGKFESFDLGIW